MADKTPATKAKTPGVQSGVMATGAVGKAARKANQDAFSHHTADVPKWARPDFKPDDDDLSIDARMARLHQSRQT